MNYATYRFYDRKGRRLAVFCRYLTATEGEITTFVCSKDDQFSKAFARRSYDVYVNDLPLEEGEEVAKPHNTIINIPPEWGEIKSLINYCNANYYRYFEFSIPVQVLLSPNEAS